MFRRSRALIHRRQLSLRRSSGISAPLEGFLIGLPELSGGPIRVSALPRLSASRGQLLSGTSGYGTAVHAASFIRSRHIVLEDRLLRQPRLMRLILLHEIFHFVWVRLSNKNRREYSRLLEEEFAAHARGELGYSAHLKKAFCPVPGTRAWRDYVCESFCDTAAFVFSGFARHTAFTLSNRWRRRRELWFIGTFKKGCRC